MDGNRLAVADLSSRKISTEPIPEEWRHNYLGGRGLNMFLLRSRFPPPVEPLSPENPLIFGTGLLTGFPGFGSRFHVTAYSPASGNLGDSNCGGHFGPELRFAGFDYLIITGRSTEPVYLLIQDGKIDIKDATRLWGLGTRATQQTLRQMVGDERLRVMTIGPAGERLVRMANIMTGPKNSAGRFGMGAVMGSKNLKAIAVRGSAALRPADGHGLLAYAREAYSKLWTRKWIKALGTQGTPLLMAVANEGGWITSRNDQGGPLGERGRAIYADSLQPYARGMASCFGCTVHCRHRHQVSGSAPGEGPEYSAFVMFGANFEVLQTDKLIQIVDLINEYGLDVMDTGIILAFAFELYNRGIIADDVSEIPLPWGDAQAITTMVHKLARRQGLGDILAEGSFCLGRLPPAAAPYLACVKNALLGSTPGGRVVKGFGMAHAVSTIGGHLHRNRPGILVLGLPPKVLEDVYGGPVTTNYMRYDGVSRAVWWHEVLNAVCDSLGFCHFQTVLNSPNAPNYAEYADLLRLIMGWDVTKEELVEIGERIATTERLLLGQMGIGSREFDTLPRRWFEEPVPEGPARGEVIDRVEFNKFLDEFYALHQWDNQGRPTIETINRLGLA